MNIPQIKPCEDEEEGEGGAAKCSVWLLLSKKSLGLKPKTIIQSRKMEKSWEKEREKKR